MAACEQTIRPPAWGSALTTPGSAARNFPSGRMDPWDHFHEAAISGAAAPNSQHPETWRTDIVAQTGTIVTQWQQKLEETFAAYQAAKQEHSKLWVRAAPHPLHNPGLTGVKIRPAIQPSCLAW